MKHNPAIITKVDLSHINELISISKATFYETYAHENTAEDMQLYLEQHFSQAQMEKELNQPDVGFYFALVNETAAGYIKVNYGKAQTESKYPGTIEIERIYVLQQFQGSGTGKILFDKATALGREQHLDFLWLGVWEKNTKAIDFYKKNGLVQFDTHIFKLGSDEQLDLLLKYDLS
jgi:diamine N-acetyltransferase